MLVVDRPTCNQFFFAQAQSPWNTGQRRSLDLLTRSLCKSNIMKSLQTSCGSAAAQW